MQHTSSHSLLALCLALLCTQSTAQAITYAPEPTPAAGGDWATAVTWPAGCESWANPCPAGAKTSGAAPTAAVVTWPAGCESWANPCPASAVMSQAPASWSSASDYTNPLTSYTTMTNGDGIITGMPPVATVASGVDSVLAWQSSALATGHTTLSTMITAESSSIPSYSFAQAATSATSAPYTGAAVANRVTSAAAALAAAGSLMVFFS